MSILRKYKLRNLGIPIDSTSSEIIDYVISKVSNLEKRNNIMFSNSNVHYYNYSNSCIFAVVKRKLNNKEETILYVSEEIVVQFYIRYKLSNNDAKIILGGIIKELYSINFTMLRISNFSTYTQIYGSKR